MMSTIVLKLSAFLVSSKDGRLLSVTLRAQPVDAANAIHPLSSVGLTGQTSNESCLAARALCRDVPIVFRNPNNLELNFWFCHSGLLHKKTGFR